MAGQRDKEKTSPKLEAFRFPFALGPKANGGKVKSERAFFHQIRLQGLPKWRTNVPLRCELPQYLSPPVAQTLALPKDSADDPTEDRVLRDACGPLRRNNAPLSSPMAMGEIVGMKFMVKALTMAATTLLRPPGQSIQVFRSLPKAHPCSEGASCHLCGPGEGKISVKRGAPSCPQRSGANHYNADSFRCNTRS